MFVGLIVFTIKFVVADTLRNHTTVEQTSSIITKINKLQNIKKESYPEVSELPGLLIIEI